MTKDELLIEIGKNVPYFINYASVRAAVDAYTEASNCAKPIVSGSLPLSDEQCTILAKIGSKYVYENASGYGRISEAGVFEIIKHYEMLKRQ